MANSNANLQRVYHTMHVFQRGFGTVLIDNYYSLPSPHREEIYRLGKALWDEINEAKKAAVPLSDEGFQNFKAKLLKKPRKNSRLFKEVNHG